MTRRSDPSVPEYAPSAGREGRATGLSEAVHFCAIVGVILNLTVIASAAKGADVFNGKKLYDRECAQCHGSDGNPQMPATPNFVRGQGLMQPDTRLRQTIRNGKRLMPAFERRLSNDEISDVLSYIRTLQRY